MVTVITVNFRQAAVTCALLDSIRRENYFTDVEVIVVDNGSESDETNLFKKHYPDVKVLISRENLGFAGGNNLAIRVATGDFLFFINNDTEWTPGLLEGLLARMAQDPQIGVVSPKIRYFNDPERIQYAGFTAINPFTGRNRAIGKNELDKGQHDRAYSTAYAHGAAMLVRRAVIETVGMMDENFFLYYEELDWCARMRRAGFTIWYEPRSVIYHKESVAVGRVSPLKVFYQTRNRLIFMKKNNSTLPNLFFTIFFMVVVAPINSFRFSIKKESFLCLAFWRGIYSGFNG